MSYSPSSKSTILKVWKSLGSFGLGRWAASKIVCIAAPYFHSIKPLFTKIEAGHVELTFNKRRSVTNHIKTVHAIAMCNAAELAGGTCMDVSLDSNFRWIPVGMKVEYLKLAKTNLRAICKIDDFHWDSPQDVIMPVSLYDTNDGKVFHADISMRISQRKKS